MKQTQQIRVSLKLTIHSDHRYLVQDKNKAAFAVGELVQALVDQHPEQFESFDSLASILMEKPLTS